MTVWHCNCPTENKQWWLSHILSVWGIIFFDNTSESAWTGWTGIGLLDSKVCRWEFVSEDRLERVNHNTNNTPSKFSSSVQKKNTQKWRWSHHEKWKTLTLHTDDQRKKANKEKLNTKTGIRNIYQCIDLTMKIQCTNYKIKFNNQLSILVWRT